MTSSVLRWAPLAVIGVILCGYFAPALLEGRLLAPGDGLAYYFPVRVLAQASLAAGELPFWNPYNFGGMPLLAALQAGVFFPGNWLFAVLPPLAAMNAAVIATYGTAAAATFLYARTIGLHAAASVFAGLSFALGGFMIAHLEHLAMIQAAAMMPVLLWAVEKLATTGRHRFAWALALAFAAQLFAGHPQATAYSGLVCAAYALWRLPARPDRRSRWTYLALLAAGGAGGLGLALVQLLPSIDFIGQTQRHAIAYFQLISQSVPPRYLATLWVPFLFGSEPSALQPTPYWGIGEWMGGYYGYVGLPPLLLAGLALRERWRDPLMRFWALTALVALGLALGGFTPLYRGIALVPVLNMMPAPNRHWLEFTFAAAMLGAIGLDALLQPGQRRWLPLMLASLPLVGIVAAVALFGAAFAARTQPYLPPRIQLASALSLIQPAFWLPLVTALAVWMLVLAVKHPGWRAWGLVALLAGDLAFFGHHHGWRTFSPRWADAAVAPVLAPSGGRTLSLADREYPYFGAFRALRHLHQPGFSALDGVRSVNGYDAFIYRRHAEYFKAGSGGYFAHASLWTPGHHALEALGLSEVRLERGLAARSPWRERLSGPEWRREDHEDVAVFKRREVPPLAWRPTRVEQEDAASVARRMTSDASFNLDEVALIEKAPPAERFAAGTVNITARSANRIQFETAGAGPGFVVISESFDPGWRAESGGRALPVQRADGLLIGLAVPAGAQAVTLHYEAPRWREGLCGSLGTAGLLLFWGAWRWRRRRPGGYEA